MAPRKPRNPKSVRISLEDGDGGAESAASPESVTDSVLAEQAESGASTRVPQGIIRRVEPMTGKETYLDSVALSLVTEEWIAQTYGGGKYRVTKMGVRDGGKWGYVGSETYEIDDSLPFKGSLKAQQARGPMRQSMGDDDEPIIFERNGTPVGGGGLDPIMQTGVLTLLKAQQESATLQQQMVTSLMQAANANQTMMQQAMLSIMEQMRDSGKSRVDVVALIAALGPIVAPLLNSLLGKKGSELETLLPLLEKLRAPNPSEKMEDMLKLVRDMKETAEVFSGGDGDGGGGGIMKTISPLVAALAPLLMQPAAAGARAPTPMPMPAAPTGVPASPALPLVEGNVAQHPLDVLAPYMPQLMLAARLNRRPAAIAAAVEGFAPDEQRGMIRELLADPNFESALVERFPEVKQYPTWMTELLDELRLAFIGEEMDGDDHDDAGDTPAKEN